MMLKINRKIIIFLFIITLQASTLFTYYKTEIAPFPPRFYDQAGYLLESYSLSWQAQKTGLQTLIEAPFTGASPQGALFVTEGAALNLFAGGGRLSQLMLNFAAFLLAEAALYLSVKFTTKQTGLGLAAVGLFLAQHSMWNTGGGIFDFRIDFLALCLYGVSICLAVRSGVFLIRRWTILTALCMAILALNRFIIIPDIIGFISAVLFVILILNKISHRIDLKMRARNILSCFFVLFIVLAPIVIISHSAIYKYYVVGHLIGPEKAIRAALTGLTDWTKALEYYPISIGQDHLGIPFGIGCLCLLFGSILAMFRRPAKIEGVSPLSDSLLEATLVAASILVPLVVLSLDESKSPVVGGIVCIPLILLITLLPRWLGLIRLGRGNRPIWLVAGCVIFAFGLFTQLNYAAKERFVSQREDDEQWAEGLMWLVADAGGRQLESPLIFFDTISDHLNAYAITAFGYEQTGAYKFFQTGFGNFIYSFEAPQAMTALALSDYVILTSHSKPGLYPFDESMERIEPQVREWTLEHLIFRHRFEMFGDTVDIYSKPRLSLYGVSGDWLLTKGASLRLIPADIKPGQMVVLHGPDSYQRLVPIQPAVSAIADIPGRAPIAIPASFHRIGDEYEIDLDPAALRSLGDQPIDIGLTFDQFFVPKERGINADTRQLVILKPTGMEVRSTQ